VNWRLAVNIGDGRKRLALGCSPTLFNAPFFPGAMRPILPHRSFLRYTHAMIDYIQVVTTTESREDAEQIARSLVEERLAACVQVIGPIISTYRWRGQIETAQEWQCWIKSRRDLYDRIEQAIRRLHPYEVPEILAIPAVAGSADYLAWLEAETGETKSE
jgi:periplasmic divalent cation tolerance protein